MICDRERQRERMLRENTETTERVDVARRRRVRTCLSLSVNKLPESSRANPVRFLPSYEHCYTVAETREGSRIAAAIMSSPTGSPFADVIQSLAGLHQEHHQALLDMRTDQERRFCALVQNQQEDRKLLPRPPTCRYRIWGRWTTRRRSSTCSRKPQRHVGGPRQTGQCASSPC